MLSPNPPKRKDGRRREKAWSKGSFSFCQEVKNAAVNCWSVHAKWHEHQLEMQPLLLREQNVNACASFVHTTRCKIQRGTRTHVVHREHVDEAARGAVAEVGFARTYVSASLSTSSHGARLQIRFARTYVSASGRILPNC